MVSSMFSLDHRLAELRPSADELRIARELADAAEEARERSRSAGQRDRRWLDAHPVKVPARSNPNPAATR